MNFMRDPGVESAKPGTGDPGAAAFLEGEAGRCAVEPSPMGDIRYIASKADVTGTIEAKAAAATV
jgi:hypothetical protein